VSDVLFAIANVLSIARTTYLMPAFEVLGPLQISLGRMIGDITRFLVLFTLVYVLTSAFLTHADDSRVNKAFIHVCVSMCVCLSAQKVKDQYHTVTKGENILKAIEWTA